MLKNIIIVFFIILLCSGCSMVEYETYSVVLSSPEESITEKQLSDFFIQYGFRGPKNIYKDTEVWSGITLEIKQQKIGFYWDKGHRENYCIVEMNNHSPAVITISGYPVLNPEYKQICDAFELYLKKNNNKFQSNITQKFQKKISVFLRNQSSVPLEKYDKKNKKPSAK